MSRDRGANISSWVVTEEGLVLVVRDDFNDIAAASGLS